MSHSVIAGLGVLLGYRGQYGIYRAMQDSDVGKLIDRIIAVVLQTVAAAQQMAPADFARDTISRLNNPNIPDDPMRIAFNGSTKMKPRFLDTYFAALQKGMDRDGLDIVLLPVAGFLRYTLGVDDSGERYELESDPQKELLQQCGSAAALGKGESVSAFKPCIANSDIMGSDLYAEGDIGKRLEELTAGMLAGPGAVRATMQRLLSA
jgi:fructuronate reductase